MENEKIEVVLSSVKELYTDESNDIYMTLDIVVVTNEVNGNDAHFTEDFIDGHVANKDKYIGIPLVVNRSKLENGEWTNLGHELQSDGTLKTDQIGSFVDFWKDTLEDGSIALMSKIRVMKRYEETCAAINELYADDKLRFSVESMVREYSESEDENIRVIDYKDGANELFGSCIVTTPAETRSKASLLVAELVTAAFKRDLDKLEVNELDKQKENKKEYTPIIHITELSEQSLTKRVEMVRDTVYAMDNYDMGEYFYVREIYMDRVIVSYETRSEYKLYQIGYTLADNKVTLQDKSEWVEVEIQYSPTQPTQEEQLMEQELQELKNKVSELETVVAEKEAKIVEVQELFVAEQKVKVELESKVTELQGQLDDKTQEVAELLPFKEQVETAKKEQEIAELKAEYAALLSEETLSAEETVQAFESLDKTKLDAIVVAEVKKKVTETAQDHKENEDTTVKVLAQQQTKVIDWSSAE